jgi:hypothetical protein
VGDEQNVDAIEDAQGRNEPGHPAPTAPASPIAPEVEADEFKYLADAREHYLSTGRPPKGFGVRTYGSNVIVRRLGKKG